MPKKTRRSKPAQKKMSGGRSRSPGKKKLAKKKGPAKKGPAKKKGAAAQGTSAKRPSKKKHAAKKAGGHKKRRFGRPQSRRAKQPVRKPAAKKPPHPEGDRLQKVLAAAGLGSRRECEELIVTGRVEVDRTTVTELGTRVDPVKQQIRVDGAALPKVKLVYYALNKPPGVLSTNRDPSGRRRVIDLVPETDARLFTIGRLDMNSEGLILVTNDGDLANQLAHPRYGIEKVYRVQVAGRVEPDVVAQLRRGVHLAEAVCQIDDVKIKSRHKASTNLEMVLQEGRNREIRRVLARLGHKVLHLTRIAIGPVRLGKQPIGEARKLTRQELRDLRDAIGMAQE